MRTLTVEVPLPPQRLSPNFGGRTVAAQIARGRDKAMYKVQVKFIAMETAQREGWTPPARARLSLVYGTGAMPYPKDGFYRPRDVDNAIAAFKAGQDGLVEAGVIPDDTAARLELGSCTIEPGWQPGVTVTVEALE